MGKGLCDRLQRLQNRAEGIITFSDYNTKSADILQDIGWDTLDQRPSKQLTISVFKSLTCAVHLVEVGRVLASSTKYAVLNVLITYPSWKPTNSITRSGEGQSGQESEQEAERKWLAKG